MTRFMRFGIVCASAALGVLAVPLAVGQPPPAPGGRAVEAAGPREPGGVLGARLGEYLTVEGVRAEDGKVGTHTLVVDTVGGRKLARPVPIWAHNLDLPAGKRCVLKGYESGEMIGTPPAVLAAAREQGRTDVGEGQAAWQWHPHFVALIVVEPKGLEIPKK
jgi:hypothetical protein